MGQSKKNRVCAQGGASIVEYMPIITLFILISVPSMELMGIGIQRKLCAVTMGGSENRIFETYSSIGELATIGGSLFDDANCSVPAVSRFE